MIIMKQYEIVANSRGKRILVINELMDIERVPEITYEDFDAIFLNIKYQSPDELVVALQRLSPFNSNKSWIKPRFSCVIDTTMIPGMTYLLDGLTDSPMDIGMAERIEDIYERIKQIKAPRYPVELHSHIQLCLRLCNYCMVRGFLEFSSTTVPGLSTGFTALFNVLFYNKEINKQNAIFEFIEKLIEQNCVERKHFYDRIHLCPDCHSTHLFFIECCPKCKSSDISYESVIHHFRCANVSPESTYEYDGQLRCPKCKQYIRHIGVDYDRPADIYSCNSCHNTFLNADMKVYCGTCGKTCTASELQPHDINIFRFTEKAIRFIPTDEAVMTFARDIWNGYTQFDLYLKQLRWYSKSSASSNSIVVIRFRLSEPGLNQTAHLAFIQNLHIRFYKYNFTIHGKYFYLSHRCRNKEEVELSKEKMNNEVSSVVPELLGKYSEKVFYEDKMGYVFYNGENIEDFIRELTAFAPLVNKN